MEEDFLKEWSKDFGGDEKLGSHKDNVGMWYNKDGDCIQFQTKQVAVVADRVDEYLTIYRSAEDNQAIGFQLKDVKRLINKYGLEGIAVSASVKDKLLVSVIALLLRAFRVTGQSITREEGYGNAIRSARTVDDRLQVTV